METDWEEVHRILEELKDADVYEQLLALKGKIHFTESLESIREDRDPVGDGPEWSGRMKDMAKTETEKETDPEEVNRILEELKDATWCQQMRALRGKIHFTVSLEELREDRD